MRFFNRVILLAWVGSRFSAFAQCGNPAATSQLAAVCNNQSAIIQVTGLAPDDTYTVAYKINEVQQTPIQNLAASSTGVLSFSTRVLTSDDNGRSLVISGYTRSGTCQATPSSGNSTALSVSPGNKTITPATVTICSGTSTRIVVSASDSGTSYQLRIDKPGYAEDNTPVGTAVAGTGADIYLPTGNLTAQTAFNILATHTTTSCSAEMSGKSTVSITPPEAPRAPTTLQSLCSGAIIAYIINVPGAATYTISVNPKGLTQTSGTPSEGSGKINNELNDDAWSNNTDALVSVIYTITPERSAGGCNGSPFEVTVPVKPRVRVGDVIQNTKTCVNNKATFTLPGLLPNTASTIGYKFNNGATQTITGVLADAYGKAAIRAGPLLESYNGQNFTVVSISNTDPAGSCEAAVNVSTPVSVASAPSAKDILATPPSVCKGGSAYIKVLDSELNVNYQLTNVVTGAATGAPGSGTGSTVLLSAGNISAATTFKVLATNADNCISPMKNTVTVELAAEPSGKDQQTPLVCSGHSVNYKITAAGAASYIISTNSTGLSQKSGTVSAGENKTAAELQDDVWLNQTAAMVSVIYTVVPVSESGCRGTAFTVSAAIAPSPKGQNYKVKICSRGVLDYSLQGMINTDAGGSGVFGTFSWRAAGVEGVEGESVTAQSTSSITDVLSNVTSDPITVIYTVTPTWPATGCPGEDFTVSVNVDPEPVGKEETISICSNLHLNYSLINNIASQGNGVRSTFSWTAAGPGEVSGFSTAPQSGTLLADQLVNTSSSTQNVIYTVTPASLNARCAGRDFAITFSVHPHPLGQNYAENICSKTPLNVILQSTISNSVGSTFSWYGSNQTTVAGVSTSVRTSNSIDDLPENTDTQPRLVRYTVTPKSIYGCQGGNYFVDIMVNPNARISAGSDSQICPDPPGTFKLSGAISYAPNGVTWSGGAGAFSESTNPTATYTPAPAEVGSTVRLTLTAEDPDGGGPCGRAAASMQLKVNDFPIVGFTGFVKNPMYQGDPPVVLTGSQAGGAFTANPATATPISPTGPMSNATVNTTLNLAQVTFTPSNARVDVTTTVSYSYTDAETGCGKTYSESVLVKPPTSVSFKLGGTAAEPLRFCKNQGKIPLIGEPPVKADGTSSFTAITGNTVVYEGGKYYFETTGLEPRSYRVKYVYDASTNSESTRDIVIVDSPAASFITDKSEICLGEKVTFTDTSSPDGSHTDIDMREWRFGDPDITDGEVEYNAAKTTAAVPYSASPGNFVVLLKITTQLGCIVTSNPTIIRVGTPSAVNFSSMGQCTGNSTKFSATSTNATDTYNWDFGDGTGLVLDNAEVPEEQSNNGQTSGTGKEPVHRYTLPKAYTVKLSVGTTSGCNSRQVSRTVNMLNHEILEPNGFSFYDFNDSDQGWVVEAYEVKEAEQYTPGDTSWIRSMPPAGISKFYAGESRQKVWWTGSRRGSHLTTYAKNENSAVLSPCFNLKKITSPMISLDYCVDTEKDYDGAVLQYSLNDDQTWLTAGDNSGNNSINWYNSNNIQAIPGDQKGFVFGWTGTPSDGSAKETPWRRAAFSLPDDTRAERIRFRISFGSNDKDQDNTGFGFDNVFIGEKQRNVLIEHFTNNNPDISQSDMELSALLRGKTHVNEMRYHTRFPTDDKLYDDNPTDPGARALYYNIAKPPYTLLNGLPPPGGKPLGDTENLTSSILQQESLKQAFFTLRVKNDDTVTEEDYVKVMVRLIAQEHISDPVLLQAALIEKSVNTDNYTANHVVRKLLFGPEGKIITANFDKNDVLDISSNKMRITFPLTGTAGNCFYAAFIQNKNTREVYQSVIIQAPDKKGASYTDIQNREQVFIFPNPAKDFIFLPTRHQQALWSITDQTGRTLLAGEWAGSSDYHQVNLAGFAQGIYIVIIRYYDKAVSRNKMVVR